MDFPLEIIGNILSRLPIQSILRFKTVCKRWRNLIQDPHFINSQFNCALERPHNLLLVSPGILQESGSLCFLDGENCAFKPTNGVPFKEGKRFTIASSCNGVLCLVGQFDDFPVCLYNPITNECVALPQEPTHSADDIYLGFDSKTSKYKVFRLVHGEYYYLNGEIITTGDNTWRELYFPYEAGSTVNFDHQVASTFFNDSFHWFILENSEPVVPDHILALDIHEETFRVIQFPQLTVNDRAEKYFFKLVTSSTSLAIAGCTHRLFSVWRLVDSKAGVWTHDYKCELPIFMDSSPRSFVIDMPSEDHFRVRLTGYNLEIGEDSSVEHQMWGVALYYPRREHGAMKLYHIFCGSHGSFSFEPSLLPIGGF